MKIFFHQQAPADTLPENRKGVVFLKKHLFQMVVFFGAAEKPAGAAFCPCGIFVALIFP
jgi:hypothetical protein